MKAGKNKGNGEISDQELFKLFRGSQPDDYSCEQAVIDARVAFLFIKKCEKIDLNEALYDLMQNK